MGTLRDNELITQFTIRQKRQIIHTCALQKGTKDVNTFVFWYSTANVTTVRWNNVKTTPKPSKSKSDCTKNLEKQGQESTPTNKCGKERINRSQDPVQEPNELTRKLDASGIFLQPHPARLRRGGNHQTNGGRHGLGMNIELFFHHNCKVFHSQAVAISNVSDGWCKHYTNPTHISHFRTREFFSRGSSLCLCLIKQSSSHLASHVSCAVVVVFLIDVSCTCHSHSKSDFLTVPFTWRWSLRRTTTRSDVRPIGWIELTYSIYTHFPKDRNCDICKKTKTTRAPCRKRTGTAIPQAEIFGDLILADHKVLSEGCESRNNHR